jgi:hypothetical protein
MQPLTRLLVPKKASDESGNGELETEPACKALVLPVVAYSPPSHADRMLFSSAIINSSTSHAVCFKRSLLVLLVLPPEVGAKPSDALLEAAAVSFE